jgi:gliding motility-associated-like protein
VVLANVFNPLNSTFGIEPFEEITLVNEFSIFDRWGSRIFEEKEFTPDDHSKRWDGTFNGTIVNNGVYVFAIYYTDQVGKIISIYGDVAVIR